MTTGILKTRFVGVGRFSDPSITELTGCVRDAVGLSALFEDTFADIDNRLLVDEAATADAIRESVLATLETAGDDDAVVISFATHGTEDHRIVAYDTTFADLDGTTVSMTALADSFRRCRARFVLCILDCCFGGEAPARVVLGTPKSRALIDLTAFEGTGRLLLAASRMDQPAYEHPTRRHGLLTAALLDALTSEEHGGVLAMVEAIINRVRTDAAAMGVDQHPVATTYVDGGWTLPVLRRGDRFRDSFPEHAGLRVAALHELSAFGIPPEVIDEWRARFDDHLHDLQLGAINDFRVLDGQSLFVLAPTSSGKTFIGEMAAVRAIVSGRKAVFLLPYKALVNEKYDDFADLYGARLGMRVIRCTGDHHDQLREFRAGKFDIALLTYEMFLGITVGSKSVLNLLGLVVLDEAQLITDRSRGINVELLLTLFRSARARGIVPQLVLLSATVGGMNHFDQWLSIQTLRSDTRPVPLEFGVLDRRGVYQYLDSGGSVQTKSLLAPHRILQRRGNPSSQDVIVPLAREILQDTNANETILVFRNKRGRAEGCAGYLAAGLGLPPARDALDSLPAGDLSTTSPKLRVALTGGTAFHTSNLSREERVVVERQFRRREGGVRVLSATSGVAAGINTPASTVVIVETTLAGPENEAMSVGTVRNMAGRAGRFGYRETGRAVILAETPFERDRLFRQYVLAPSEPIASSFDAGDLSTWVVRLLRQVDSVPRAEVAALLVNTYGGYLHALRDPGFVARIQTAVPNLLGRMERSELIEEDAKGVHLTSLGRACGQSTLAFESCLLLLEALRAMGEAEIRPVDLLGITQALPESDQTYIPLQKKGQKDLGWGAIVAGRLTGAVARSMLRGADAPVAAARAKRTLVALDWANGVPLEQIERSYSVNPFFAVEAGDIRGIAESARFRLRSVVDIAAVAVPLRLGPAEGLDLFFRQLEFGLPPAALDLVTLPMGLTRAECLELYGAGLSTASALKGINVTQLESRLSKPLVARLNAWHEAQTASPPGA
jgi:helicase